MSLFFLPSFLCQFKVVQICIIENANDNTRNGGAAVGVITNGLIYTTLLC